MVRNTVVVGAMLLVGLLAGETQAAFRNPDGVAVIIGNRAYEYDVPQVTYAHRDAEAFQRYVVDVLGFDPENVIYEKDVDKATMERVFGNKDRLTGSELWRYLHPEGSSDVVVFYSGHGIPGLNDKRGYLLPVNAHPDAAELNGYPIDVLYDNLVKLKERQAVRSVQVFLDACFSGDSGGGRLIGSTSAIRVAPLKELEGVDKLTILTAASGKEVASWDKTSKHGLFTHHLLNALYGEGDVDSDGQVTAGEAKVYLDRHMTRAARRTFGRVQNADLRGVETAVLARAVGGIFPVRPAITPQRQVGERFRDCPSCPEMVVVPAGSYEMGSVDGASSLPSRPIGYSDSHPVHRVTISKPLAVGVYEVTRGEFGRFVEATGYSTGNTCIWGERRDFSWRNPGFAQTDQHPVVCVSWKNAQAYVQWLSQETGQAYRLLSEAEWEYVARAGTRTARYWGQDSSGQCLYANGADAALLRSDSKRKQFNDETAKEQAKTLATIAKSYSIERQAVECDDGYAWTSPVGAYGANGFGLHDVLGNVSEWVQDCWHTSYHSAPSDGRAWESADCSEYVKRKRIFEWKRKERERIELEFRRKSKKCDPRADPNCLYSTLLYYDRHFFKQDVVVLRRVTRGGSWYGDALSIRSDVRDAATTYEYSDIGFPATKEEFLQRYYDTFHDKKFPHLDYGQFTDFVERDSRKDPTVFGQMAEEMEVSKLIVTPKFRREYYDAYRDKFKDIPYDQFNQLVDDLLLQQPEFARKMGDELYSKLFRHKMTREEFDAEFMGSIDKSDPTLLKLRSKAEGLVQGAKTADASAPQTSERNRASTPVWTITAQNSSYITIGFRVAQTLN